MPVKPTRLPFQCCGSALKGKNTMMDNNSGHYQPSDGHFMTLLKLLHDGGATDASIKVGTHSTVPGFGSFGSHSGYMSVDSYLNKVKDKAKTYSYDLTNLATGT
ncbi:hypothetical protein [Pararhodobacter sp. SW119]|uniref:hypothetical protein n=1 Tax=Pararhodobacter sp. SW119 TaxID=2780075 RepID=UPI001ADF5199|nr:hypothetical protein [Pararhodobacter sp. SW119]